MKFLKDVYISDAHKEKIVDFLTKKTGMEWYVFRRAGEITSAVKPYLIEMVKGFDDAKISFESHEEYLDTCEYCIQRFGKRFRVTFSFSKEEFELIKEKIVFLLYIYKKEVSIYRNTHKFWGGTKRKRMSLISHIYIGKIQKFTIWAK